MSNHDDPFADFDGAYILGALSDEDRQAYERHLATCDSCAASVRSLGRLPVLLGTVDDPNDLDHSPGTAADALAATASGGSPDQAQASVVRGRHRRGGGGLPRRHHRLFRACR